MEGSEDLSFAIYDWEQTPGESPTCTAYLLNVNWWEEKAGPAEARFLWNDTTIPLQITPGRLAVFTLQGDWGIGIDDVETDTTRLEARQNSVRISLQGSGEVRLTILHKQAEGEAKLQARSRNGTLELTPTETRGVWHTRIALDGPEIIEVRLA